MGKINRTDVIQRQINDLGVIGQDVAHETSDKVVWTYDLNPKFSRFVLSSSATTTGTISLNLPSVSVGSEIFVTGVQLSLIKDATCDVATGRVTLTLTPDESNVAIAIIGVSVITLTAQSENISLSLPYPLKLKAGSAITCTGTYSVGVMSKSIYITGFKTS